MATERPTPQTDAFIAALPPVRICDNGLVLAHALRELMIAHAEHARKLERANAGLVEALEQFMVYPNARVRQMARSALASAKVTRGGR